MRVTSNLSFDLRHFAVDARPDLIGQARFAIGDRDARLRAVIASARVLKREKVGLHAGSERAFGA